MTTPTYGVTSGDVQSRLPQIDVDASAPITAARAAAIIESCAAEVSASIEATWGAGTAATISADTASIAYAASARCVVTLCLPEFYLAAHHGVDPDVYEALASAASALRARLRSDPSAVIGYLPTSPPGVSTSTQALDLDTTDTPTAAPVRSRWGGASSPATARGWQL